MGVEIVMERLAWIEVAVRFAEGEHLEFLLEEAEAMRELLAEPVFH